MKSKKIIPVLMSIVLLFAGCKPGGQIVNSVDKDKTQLNITSFEGGFGQDWLYAVADRFMQEYEGTSFEEGKQGVQITIQPDEYSLPPTNITGMNYDVFFYESVDPNSYITRNQFLDITDIVTATNTDGKTIESKLTQNQKDSLKINGSYYCLPHYEGNSAVTYDRDLFKEKSLFFKEGGGYTNTPEINGTVGPNGIRGDYDDGLPSSYEEFFTLCDRMLKVNVVPFTFGGALKDYPNHLIQSLFTTYLGEAGSVCWDFDSNGEKIDIVTGFDSNDNPIIEQLAITPETGYLTSQTAAAYYAQWFLEKCISNSAYWSTSAKTGSASHTDDHRTYVNSRFESDMLPIAMKLDGSWWYREAGGALKDSYVNYVGAENRDFAVMPLPWKVTGTVTEGNGRRNTLNDITYAFAFINGKLANDPDKAALAKLFLQYCYTDESLQEFTMTSSTFKALDYELTEDQLKSVDNYVKNLSLLRKVSDIVYPYSNSKIYIANQGSLAFYYWDTNAYTGSADYGLSYIAMKDHGVSAKNIFAAMEVTQEDWVARFSQYFS